MYVSSKIIIGSQYSLNFFLYYNKCKKRKKREINLVDWVQGFKLVEPAKHSRIGKGMKTPKRNRIVRIFGRFSPLHTGTDDFPLLLLILCGSLERWKNFAMKHISLT